MREFRFVMLSFLVLIFAGFSANQGLGKRAVKEVEKVFDSNGLTFAPVTIEKDLQVELPTKISGENLFRVTAEGNDLGFVFAGQAPSKTAQFDYLVIFDPDFKILHTKVLLYREEYGGEIGSNRWLKQFIGLTFNDSVTAGENIDMISGATISVNSMTKAMDNLLESLRILKEKGQL